MGPQQPQQPQSYMHYDQQRRESYDENRNYEQMKGPPNYNYQAYHHQQPQQPHHQAPQQHHQHAAPQQGYHHHHHPHYAPPHNYYHHHGYAYPAHQSRYNNYAPPQQRYEEERPRSFTFTALPEQTKQPPASRSPSPPAIPPPPESSPPPEAPVEEQAKKEEEEGGPLRESRRQNVEGKDDGKKKKNKTVDAASILLEFQKTSKASSPATTIESIEGESLKQKVTEDEDEAAPGIPKEKPTRLALPGDAAKLNKLHCFVRSELLEIFVLEKSKQAGRVGMRCVFCAEARKKAGNIPKDEAAMAFFYPKSLSEIYRLVTSWQRCHLRKCKTLPPTLRSTWQQLRELEKSRGKTAYWISSAKEIGLVDIPSKAGGIRFDV